MINSESHFHTAKINQVNICTFVPVLILCKTAQIRFMKNIEKQIATHVGKKAWWSQSLKTSTLLLVAKICGVVAWT